MWIKDTHEHEAMHIEGMTKDTVLDAFVYPFKAICAVSPNGDLCQEIRGHHIGNITMVIKKMRGKPKEKTSL